MIEKLAKIKAWNFFLFVSISFGTLFILISPPFQVPDEINHFYKTYQISDGVFLSEKIDGRLGGYVPKSFVEITNPFLYLKWNTDAKSHAVTAIQQFSVALNEESKVFVDFPNTAIYSPISYLPQSLIVFVLKTFNTPPIFIFYITKWFMLLLWSFCIWHFIKIIPIYKWLFAVLALLPMSVYINASFSADVVTNVLAFGFITYVFCFLYTEESISIKTYILLVAIASLLASAKFVYVPVVLLFFLLRRKKIEGFNSFYFAFGILLIISFSNAFWWSKVASMTHIPYSSYNTNYRDGIDLVKCANIQEQLTYIITHGIYILHVFVNSIYNSFDMYYRGYIGTFGWLDTYMPYSIINAAYGMILFVSAFEDNKGLVLHLYQKIIISFVLLMSLVLVLLSQHLSWDCVGGDLISTIQGRYFIPILPLLFILISSSLNKYNLKPFVIVLTISILCYSSYTIYNRYYKYLNYFEEKVFCDAENINAQNYLTTNNPHVVLENGSAQNNKYSKSGKHSIVLNIRDPFGFIYKTTQLKEGDDLYIETWRLGNKGGIILSGESGKLCYISSQDATEKDTNGWRRLYIHYQATADVVNKEMGIYIYNPSPDTSYFDDLLIIKKSIIK